MFARPLLALLVVAHLGASQRVVFYDNFTACAQTGSVDPSLWTLSTRQWGCSNCNGGVNPDNVACGVDPSTGAPVLELTAHGDLFNGTGPTGVYRNLSARSPTDEFTGWAWPQYKAPCSPHCDVRRVGGALHTNQFFGHSGNITLQIRMKPCAELGAATAAWMYNYTETYCDTTHGEACSQAYQDWCCGGSKCYQWTDQCWGEWVDNQEIDIELPTSRTGTDDPSQISFDNARFTTITAIKSVPQAKCGSNPPCSKPSYRNLGYSQIDGNYHLYTMDWVPPSSTVPEGSLTFYVDGKLWVTVSGSNIIPSSGQLWLGTWFPNAWAGSPDFDTCVMAVDYVSLTAYP